MKLNPKLDPHCTNTYHKRPKKIMVARFFCVKRLPGIGYK